VTQQPGPVGVCIATRTITCRLIIRHSYPSAPIAWPLLVIDKCPWTPDFTAGHAHLHWLCTPGPRQWKVAPCNRQPYMIRVAG
jgi:hypothetical protein